MKKKKNIITYREIADVLNLTIGSIKYAAKTNKKKLEVLKRGAFCYIKNITLEELEEYNKAKITKIKENKMKTNKPIVIAVVNFKGGVGKSTIANILDLDKKIVLNLDVLQRGEKLNCSETYDLAKLQELGVETAEEAIEATIETGEFENIVIDTPGEINNFVSILKEVDFFIVPFSAGKRSIEATLTTIEAINEYLDINEERKDKWIIVLNNYTNDRELEELDKIEQKVRDMLKDHFIGSSNLKHSAVVPTMERRRMSPEELAKENIIAYSAFKKRVRVFSDSIKKYTKGTNNV